MVREAVIERVRSDMDPLRYLSRRELGMWRRVWGERTCPKD
jgi:hypothetical protein